MIFFEVQYNKCIFDSAGTFHVNAVNKVGLHKVQGKGCLRKKYSESDCRYLKNGDVQQGIIFRNINTTFIWLCVKFQSQKSNITKSHKRENSDGTNGT